MIVALLLLAVLVILYFSIQNWRLSVYTALLLVVFEGVLRKWIVPQLSEQILFLKDVFLLGAYIRFYFVEPPRKQTGALFWIKFNISILIIWCIVQSFSPQLGSPFIGLWGIKAYVYYAPLIWMVPFLFTSKSDLSQFLNNYLLLVIPVGLLGVAQFFSPASSPINVYAGGANAVASFSSSENVRITGTFPYLSGYSTFAAICFALLLPLLLEQKSRQWLLFSKVIIIVITSFMTGSRSLILFEFLFLASFFLSNLIYQPKKLTRFAVLFVLLAIGISALISQTSLGLGFRAFMGRATSSDSVTDRIVGEYMVIPWAVSQTGLVGYGTGSRHQATQTIINLFDLPTPVSPPPFPEGLEGEFLRVTIELGVIGVILWMLLKISLVIYSLLTLMRLKDSFLWNLGLSLLLLQVIQFGTPVVYNHVYAIYFWFLNGFILLLPKLEPRREIDNRRYVIKTRFVHENLIHTSYS